MNLREALLKEHSKVQTMRIVEYVGDDKERFAQLMDLFLNDVYRVSQRAFTCCDLFLASNQNIT